MVNVREVFWSMVRNPELLMNYVRDLGLTIEPLCDDVKPLKCPPDAGDDFRTRFLVISYLYLRILLYEVQSLSGSDVNVEGIPELISDVITDMRLYNAPPKLFELVIRLSRELLHLSSSNV
ncbi:hypothetical protein B7L70_10695 [Vulcanisaeta sp. EB80]|jgi:hypothetical protein|uniref:hypothetical protein n=1 Tax=Vulcanisaeta sp. EB80 TaxID=1650660 RepID=UPI0007476D6B|nr:hypothetical protein [Vulcanisaeta sp. EB80]KUO85398.1 MAG: hypothetical protein AT716_05970 [Vulcanisaeta sp. MG_3]MCG2867075.1 hypothetical protein [Vulcanisaeta sp.]MDT7863956.1 hypothetical protein [Vulcanisaeta sp.]PLC64863.1 hypothetical protein B7L70_10695 [Vulcanisaeta sp. EB80]